MLRGGGIELRSPASQLAVAVLARPAHAYENLGHSLTHSPVAVLLRKDRRLSLLKAGFAVYTTRHIVLSPQDGHVLADKPAAEALASVKQFYVDRSVSVAPAVETPFPLVIGDFADVAAGDGCAQPG